MPDQIDKDGNFNRWVRYAKNEEMWNEIIHNFFWALGGKNETTRMWNNEKKGSLNFSWHLDELLNEVENEE